MDRLPDGAYLRLRSRVRSAYLHADEDGLGISLRPLGRVASMNAVWRLQREVFEGSPCVCLQGAAYGRYLATTAEEAPPGHRGRRTVQRDFAGPSLNALMWRAYGVGDGYIRLRHEYNFNLRANGRHRFWLKAVTVDSANGCRMTTMMHWRVEIIQPKSAPPPLSLEAPNQGSRRGLFRRHTVPQAIGMRTIMHVQADEDGLYAPDPFAWQSFSFYGRSIYNLKIDLGLIHQPDDTNVLGITTLVRPGFHGRLMPLVTDLARTEETMYIVVFANGTPAAQALRYPDI